MKIKKRIDTKKLEDIISIICSGTLVFLFIYMILTYEYIDNINKEFTETEITCPITYMSYDKISEDYKVSYIDNLGKVQTFFAHDIYISDANKNIITFYFNDIKCNKTEKLEESFMLTLEEAIEKSKLNEDFKILVTEEMYEIAMHA